MLAKIKVDSRFTFSAHATLVHFLVPFVLFGAQASNLRAQPNIAQQQQNRAAVTTLEFGKPIERELAGERGHDYQITLADGQYASAVLEQRGIDAVVRLIGEDGNAIIDFD